MLGMGNPRLNLPRDIIGCHRAGAPAVAQSAQAIAKTAHIVFRQTAAAIRQQFKPEKGRGLAGGQDDRLARM